MPSGDGRHRISPKQNKTGEGSEFSSRVRATRCFVPGLNKRRHPLLVLSSFPLKEKTLSFQISKALEFLTTQQRELSDTGENVSQVKQKLSELDNLEQTAQVSPVAMENSLMNMEQPLLLVDKGCSLLNIIFDKENSPPQDWRRVLWDANEKTQERWIFMNLERFLF